VLLEEGISGKVRRQIQQLLYFSGTHEAIFVRFNGDRFQSTLSQGRQMLSEAWFKGIGEGDRLPYFSSSQNPQTLALQQ
jgi:hypothetical protein